MKCLNCNQIIKRGHGLKANRKYCSYSCYQLKTPLVIKLEAEFNQPIEALMVESEQMDCSQVLKAYSLGINRETYRRYKEIYC